MDIQGDKDEIPENCISTVYLYLYYVSFSILIPFSFVFIIAFFKRLAIILSTIEYGIELPALML